MENNTMEKPETENPPARRYSSLSVELFGAEESALPPTSPSPSSSSGKLSSVFPPPSTTTTAGMNRSSSASEMLRLMDKRSSVGGQVWKRGSSSEDLSKDNVDSSQFQTSKERSSVFLDRPEPCSLSSSLVYGGAEDIYTRPSDEQSRGTYSEHKKDEAKGDHTGDDTHCASRGDWWQGSLYY